MRKWWKRVRQIRRRRIEAKSGESARGPYDPPYSLLLQLEYLYMNPPEYRSCLYFYRSTSCCTHDDNCGWKLRQGVVVDYLKVRRGEGCLFDLSREAGKNPIGWGPLTSSLGGQHSTTMDDCVYWVGGEAEVWRMLYGVVKHWSLQNKDGVGGSQGEWWQRSKWSDGELEVWFKKRLKDRVSEVQMIQDEAFVSPACETKG